MDRERGGLVKTIISGTTGKWNWANWIAKYARETTRVRQMGGGAKKKGQDHGSSFAQIMEDGNWQVGKMSGLSKKQLQRLDEWKMQNGVEKRLMTGSIWKRRGYDSLSCASRHSGLLQRSPANKPGAEKRLRGVL